MVRPQSAVRSLKEATMTTPIRLIRLGDAKQLTQGGGPPILPEDVGGQRYAPL